MVPGHVEMLHPHRELDRIPFVQARRTREKIKRERDQQDADEFENGPLVDLFRMDDVSIRLPWVHNHQRAALIVTPRLPRSGIRAGERQRNRLKFKKESRSQAATDTACRMISISILNATIAQGLGLKFDSSEIRAHQ